MTSEENLVSRPIPALIRQIAVPAAVGYFFNTMFNVVDTYYAGLLSTNAVASLSLSFPVFFIIIALAGGTSTGATALIGNALGAEDRRRARLYVVQSLSFGALLAVVLTVLGLLVSPFLFRVLGAQEEYLATALSYMNVIFLGSIFFVGSYMFNGALNAVGDTKSYRNFLILGFFLNLALDPWFIFGGLFVPAMGTAGIGLATILIQALGTVYLGRKAYKKGLLHIHSLRDFIPRLSIYKEIAGQGFPSAFNFVTVGLGIFIITYYFGEFGKDAVAAYGVATRVEQIALLPTIGLNISVLSITSQNSGALRFDRIYQAMRTALLYGAGIMALGTIGVYALAPTLMSAFTPDAEVVNYGAGYLHISAFALFAYVVLYVNTAAMQGVKKPLYVLLIGIARQILVPVLVFHLLIKVYDFGIQAIWWGIFGINWSAAAGSVFIARFVIRHAERERRDSSRATPFMSTAPGAPVPPETPDSGRSPDQD